MVVAFCCCCCSRPFWSRDEFANQTPVQHLWWIHYSVSACLSGVDSGTCSHSIDGLQKSQKWFILRVWFTMMSWMRVIRGVVISFFLSCSRYWIPVKKMHWIAPKMHFSISKNIKNVKGKPRKSLEMHVCAFAGFQIHGEFHKSRLKPLKSIMT